MWTLGVDIGTTGCKAVVFNDQWRIKTSVYREYGLIPVGNNQFDLDPEVVWNSVRDVIQEANNSLPDNKIEAMGISAIGDVIIPLDGSGDVVRPSIVDFDPRGTVEIEDFSKDFGVQKLFEISGMPPLFINSLSKILWLKKHEPDTFSRIGAWATYEDFILRKLGSPPAVSFSLAARTMLFDIEKKCWAEEILDAAAIDKRMLPEAVPSGEVISKIDPKMVKELGFTNDVALCSGGHDMVCAAIGAGLDLQTPHTAVDITGTIEGIVTVFEEANTGSEMLDNNYPCYPGYNGYVSFSVNLTSGCVLKWFRDELAQDTSRKARTTGKDVYSILMETIDTRELSDLLFIPYFAGSGNPDFDPNLHGAIYGLTLDTSRENIVQSLIEGLCLEVRSHLDGFEEAGMHIDSLLAVGGGSKSPAWLQLKANVTEKEITATGIPESSALGAAALSAVAVGEISDPVEVSRKTTRTQQVYKPQDVNRTEFHKKYEQYKDLKSMMKKMAKQTKERNVI